MSAPHPASTNPDDRTDPRPGPACPETRPGGDGAGLGPGVALAAEGVSVVYDGDPATLAVRDVSLVVHRGEVVGLAGESGCGKSTLAYALTRLLRPPARLAGGRVRFAASDDAAPVDIMALAPKELRRFRWRRVSMVFQSAMNALNPVTNLDRQFADIFRAHRPEMSSEERTGRARELLEMVDIAPERVHSFPHELSGGMRQRVIIAMALALDPDVVVMDEPTTALDVVVQREILDEVARLRGELGFGIVFITHDLSLLLEISDRLAVMYAGRLVETAPSEQVATHPTHPYTLGLLRSFPDLREDRRLLSGIPGSPPDLRADLTGCSFAPRCPFAFEPCHRTTPILRTPLRIPTTGANEPWQVACHLHDPDLNPSGPPPELAGQARQQTAPHSPTPGPGGLEEEK